jgi:pyruvate,water dikinase
MNYLKSFQELRKDDLSIVGGKNASIGELSGSFSSLGMRVPPGFAVITRAFQDLINENKLKEVIASELNEFDPTNTTLLEKRSVNLKRSILKANLPEGLEDQIITHIKNIRNEFGEDCSFAVRSSATCEDLPSTSFAGLHDSFLNISSVNEILACIKKCYASLYNSRALSYRRQMGVSDDTVFMSVGIQMMVRSDLDRGSAGVCFTIDPDTGFKDVVIIQSNWGLGENIVQGKVNPDEFTVYKPFIYSVPQPIISKRLGGKEKKIIFNRTGRGTQNSNTSLKDRKKFSLANHEIIQIAQWAEQIERHYGRPMDIEWAKDGKNGSIYIVQARPETVHGKHSLNLDSYTMTRKGPLITQGTAVGYGVISGRARHLTSVRSASSLKKGEIIIARTTSPDWDPILKRSAAIITERGGRTSHAAIVARELGALAIVGAENIFRKIKNGEWITVDNSSTEGKVYRGKSKWTHQTISMDDVPETKVNPLLILSEPENAFKYAAYPSKGVGLLRLEFIITGAVGIHPMALINFKKIGESRIKRAIQDRIRPYKDGYEYFIEKLSQGISQIAAAFYPRSVVVRLSDFKTDEYAGLLGGELYEEEEENPMIGLRGASRYYHSSFKAAFEMECKALKKVREEMGFLNIHLMIPFCRTISEADTILDLLKQNGLERNIRDLKIWMMCEIPSNVILAEEFLSRFDGLSIGSNDLTQLILGVDRGNPQLESLFDENDPSVKSAIRDVIHRARKRGVEIGLCGQKPSDDPSFARFLVEEGITSISFNPDALLRGIQNIYQAEKK